MCSRATGLPLSTANMQSSLRHPSAVTRAALRLESKLAALALSAIVVHSTLPHENLATYQGARGLVVIVRAAKITALRARPTALGLWLYARSPA